jgi:DNA-binding HxlR family transcriptional regulator
MVGMISPLLNEKPTCVNEIRLRLVGVTHEAVTRALRRLERNGLIALVVLATSSSRRRY